MIGAALVALALGAGPLAGLRDGVARYRVELGGEPVGVAELGVSGLAPGRQPEVTWATALRLPAEAGGAVRRRRLRVPIDRDGLGRGEARLAVDGVEAPLHFTAGTVPASAAELVLAGVEQGRCVTVTEEETGRSGPACVEAGAPGEVRRITVLGVEEEVRPGADGLPERVDVAAQGVSYVRDGRAPVPARVSLSVRVRGPSRPGLARRFCGAEPDRPSGDWGAGFSAPQQDGTGAGTLPPVHPTGESCQVQAAAYAAAARAGGLDARVAVGVAHDGAGFVWHAWAEVRTGGGWVAVDPAFGQPRARGPRFTVARHGVDAASRLESGRRILACWGRPVE